MESVMLPHENTRSGIKIYVVELFCFEAWEETGGSDEISMVLFRSGTSETNSPCMFFGTAHEI